MKISLVSKGLYRGSRPDSKDDLAYLSETCKVLSIVSLETGFGAAWDAFWGKPFDEPNCWIGNYTDFSLSNFIPPTRAQTEAVIAEIKKGLQRGNVFVHCYSGVDRTGWICAAWRVLEESKDPESAWQECVIMGMHPWFFWWKNAFFEAVK